MIAERLGAPPSTISLHPHALEEAGLVQPTRQGRRIIYAVRHDRGHGRLVIARSREVHRQRG
jgi:predicted transcriptional regulator